MLDAIVKPTLKMQLPEEPRWKICPLLVISQDFHYLTNDKHFCIEDDCALWNNVRDMCGLICPRQV